MSKQNRSGKPFRTLGQRMLSFGREVMRTYSNDVSIQPETSSQPPRPQGQWRSMSNNQLIWRQEQTAPQAPQQPAPQNMGYEDASFYEDSDYQPFEQPIQRRPQPPQQARPVQRQPQQQPPAPQQPQKPTPNYVQMSDGTPVQVSKKQFSSPLQRRLEAIAAAHAEASADRDKEREQKIENIQRKVESGELTTRRRRGSIDVDYVSTDSLISPDERSKIQAQREAESPTDTSDAPANDAPDNDNEWFDEIPDDDADIDSMAGFESSDDSIQRMPDDLPRFDASSLEEGDNDDMGEFESGYEAVNPTVTTDNPINRAYDDDDYDNQVESNSAPASDTPIQRSAQDFNTLPTFDDFDQDETVPLVPDVDPPTFAPSVDSGNAPSSDNTPVQRSAQDNTPSSDNTPVQRSTQDNTPSISDNPIQRRSIQHETENTPDVDYPAQDFADTSDSNFSPDIPSIDSTPSNSSPVQLQRTPLDASDNDLGDGGDYQDFGEQTWAEANNISSDSLPQITSADSAPVQRAVSDDLPQITSTDGSPTQRDFADDLPEITSTDGAPAQRQAVDEPQFADNASDFDFDQINQVPDVNAFDNTPSTPATPSNAPIQRAELDEYGEDDVEFSGDTGFTDMPSVDAPIQRTANDDPQFDNYSADVADTNDVISTPPTTNTPIQRTPQAEEYSDFGQDDYNAFSEAGDFPTVNQTPSDNTPVQREIMDDADLHVDAPADTLDINPGESLSIGTPKAETPAPSRRVQRKADDNTPAERPTSDNITRDNTPTPSDQPVVQRREMDRDHPDLGDGGDYQDFGEQTWAEANQVSSDTLPQITSTDSAPVQREAMDDFGDFSDVPDVNAFSDSSSDAPVQREAMDDFGDFSDVPDVNAFSDSSSDAPVQREAMDTPQFDDFSDDDIAQFNQVPDVNAFDNSTSANDTPVQRTELDSPQTGSDSLSIQPPADNTPVQRRPIQRQEPDASDAMDSLSIESPADNTPVQRRPIQRQEPDASDVMDSLSIESPADNTPVQRRPIQRQEPDASDVMESLSIESPADNTPVQRRPIQREEQTPEPETFEDFGEQTWAEANNYSPATDAHDNGTSIQREFEESRNTLPTFDDDFDGTQDTDSFTAMNILSDYVAEQNQSTPDTPATPNTGNTPIQRSAQDDDNSDYLPEGFDPTPQFYNFDAVNNDPAPSTSDTPIQRTPEDDFAETDDSNLQSLDLFSALSQMGAVQSESGNSSNIQRDMQDDDNESYDNYGEMTWAEMNNYSPATDNANTAIQRSTDENDDLADQQPMDLFSALAEHGAVTNTDSSPVQRSPQNGDHNNGVSDDMMNLYNEMMTSGMIQQTDNTSSYSNPMSSNPIQREAQPDPKPESQSVDLGEALRRATQVSDSSAHNSSESSKLGGNVAYGEIQRELDSGTGTTAGSEQVTTASTNGDDTDEETTQDDKHYMDQLARDVFRIIKRRMREEKERRG